VLNRLHAPIVDPVPGGVPARLSADAAAALPCHSRPPAGLLRTRRLLATDLVREVRRLDAEIAAIEARIGEAVAESCTALTELFGIGPILAAKILGRDPRPRSSGGSPMCDASPRLRVVS
jgi:transposase